MASHLPQQSASQPPGDNAALTQAIDNFSQLSLQLSSAYQFLENEVSRLNQELALARAQRQRERQQQELMSARLGALLEALPAAVVLIDGRDRIDRFNPAAERLFDSLAWGRRWSEVRDEQLLRVTGTGDWLLQQGSRVNVSRQPLGDGGQILVIVDVTQQRDLEQRLLRQDRLAEMGEMAAQLAHQVRTPLSTALLYGGQLGRDDLSGEHRQRFAAQLVEGLRHTEKLVSDMLAFSRGGNFLAAPVSLRQVMLLAEGNMQPRLEAQQAQLRISLGVGEDTILGNQDALVGVLCNLLDNSLNHAGDAVSIWLDLHCENETAVIRVEDDGSGIPEDVRERIFDPFFTTRERGTGLGLAVAQSVLLSHDGSIGLSESRHGGACFELRIPLHNLSSEGDQS